MKIFGLSMPHVQSLTSLNGETKFGDKTFGMTIFDEKN